MLIGGGGETCVRGRWPGGALKVVAAAAGVVLGVCSTAAGSSATDYSGQHLLDRRAQVVEADLREHAAEPLERLDLQLQERLLGLDKRRGTERRPENDARMKNT